VPTKNQLLSQSWNKKNQIRIRFWNDCHARSETGDVMTPLACHYMSSARHLAQTTFMLGIGTRQPGK